MDDLKLRIERMYAAFGAIAERDLSTFGAVASPSSVIIDFSATPAELQNALYDAIHAVAHLRDHLKRATKAAGLGSEAVTRAIEGSTALQVVIDLSNADKHGADRQGGHSRRGPRLVKIARAFVHRPAPGAPSSRVIFSFDGSPPIVESGVGEVRVLATVADKDGGEIGELDGLLNAAMDAWEGLFARIRDAAPPG